MDEHDRPAGADVLVVQLDRLAVVGADGQAGHGSSGGSTIGGCPTRSGTIDGGETCITPAPRRPGPILGDRCRVPRCGGPDPAVAGVAGPPRRQSMSRSVIVSGARTPMGRLLGSLKDLSAADLGGVAIKAALDRAGISGDQVEYVIMGQVLQAGAGQNPARPAAVAAGIPMTVPSITVNKVCLSGLSAIAMADQLIRAGEFDIVVAGGQESMTNAPHLLPNSRTGTRYGDARLVDAMAHDGLSDTFDQVAMGALTEQANSRYDLTREEQDAFAAGSHQKAAAAGKDGIFAEAITPVLIPQRKGDPIEFRDDEGVRADTTVETLARLKPAFAADGTITAGTASQISDGACAVVVMSAAKAAELGLTPLAEIGAHGVVAGPDATLQSQPSRAVQRACEREGIAPADLDLVEFNEAFAAVAIVSTRELGIDPEKVNPNGGAIALGHPIGMSGARIVLDVALELGRRGGGVGAAALCGGGGQGDALILHVPART
ncbi:acetyl-CoA C-acetyltransferase [Geodermatophilus sp. DSM 44513]|uniref:acetyl-CoA C-acetyltransferase n=1 Tax=Geodermatophilus sp. DSM 44513 TaxID=1528104 RepID=UPI001286B09F|nr:acetyl-CoA C-acetyltransferase [Geodermatophilus sp. DSM 44513]WNV74580.1 acetyl-CoA C-acetyltransferase [Geodermatophilus sp. DSM 44513]